MEFIWYVEMAGAQPATMERRCQKMAGACSVASLAIAVLNALITAPQP